MADQQTADLLDLFGAKQRIAYFEQRERDREELARLAHLAKVRFGHEVRTPDSDPDYIHRPLETRMRWEHEIEVIRKEEREKQAAKNRDAERQRSHREWVKKQETEAQLELERVEGNVKNFGWLRPETSESFSALPAPMRSRLVSLFGPSFVTELAAKTKSGLSWQQWTALKNLDPNAPQQTTSDDNAIAEKPSAGAPPNKD